MVHNKQLLATSIFIFFMVLSGCQQKGQNQTAQTTPYTNIDVATAKSIADSNQEIIFLDVRTPEETAEGKIPGAIELDFRADGFAEKLDSLNKEDAYIVYCRSGRRSAETAQMMSEKGFKKVQNMEGGFLAWSE